MAVTGRGCKTSSQQMATSFYSYLYISQALVSPSVNVSTHHLQYSHAVGYTCTKSCKSLHVAIVRSRFPLTVCRYNRGVCSGVSGRITAGGIERGGQPSV